MIELGLGRMASISDRARVIVFAVAAAQDDDVLVLLDHDAGEHPAVGHGNDRRSHNPSRISALGLTMFRSIVSRSSRR